jgi:very-short-patch-repair endonuclease
MPVRGAKIGKEHKEKIGKANTGKRRTKEQRERLSNARKRLFAEGKLETWNKGKHGIYSPETIQKISEGAKREWQNFSNRERESLAKTRSATFNRMWADENFYNKMHKVLISNNEKYRADPVTNGKRSVAMRALWKDERSVKTLKNALKLKPNNVELYLDAVLQLNFKNMWRYTGDFSFWIDGKNPDFVHVDKKLLIEYNGHPFSHTPERDRAKTEHYAKHGWKTLNLTVKDLKDEKELINTIGNFVRENSVILQVID